MLHPLNDWVLVKRREAESKIGAIVVPDAAQHKAERGTVMAVGKGRLTDDGVRIAPEVKEGDEVLFGKYSGQDITLDGEEYITMREGEILGVIAEQPKKRAAQRGFNV